MSAKVTGRRMVKQDRQDGDLPRGIHRGKLAGLTGEEREQAMRAAGCSEHRYDTMDDRMRRHDGYEGSSIRGTQSAPTGDFADCLRRTTVMQLEQFIRAMGIGRLPNKRKQTLIDALVGHVDKLPHAIEVELLACTDGEFAGFLHMLEHDEPVYVLKREDGETFCALEPLTWAFSTGKQLYAVMPREVRAAAEGVDLERIRSLRNRRWQIPRAADALRTFCGVAPLAEVAPCCKKLFGFEPGMEEVRAALRLDERNRYGVRASSWTTWKPSERSQDEYLLGSWLDEDRVAAVADGRREQLLDRYSYQGGIPWERETGYGSAGRYICAVERDGRDRLVHGIILERQEMGVSCVDAIDKQLAHCGPLEWERTRPEALALRAWLDEHIPDREGYYFVDEYRYADDRLDKLILLRNRSPDPFYMIELARSWGLFSHTFDPKELLDLLVDLECALPNWRYGGLSIRAVQQRRRRATFGVDEQDAA